jgi:hypothetical protein
MSQYNFLESDDPETPRPLTPSEQISVVQAHLSEQEDFKRAGMDFRSILHTFGVCDKVYDEHIKYLIDEFYEQLGLLQVQLEEEEQNASDEEEFLDSIEEHFADDDEIYDNGD